MILMIFFYNAMIRCLHVRCQNQSNEIAYEEENNNNNDNNTIIQALSSVQYARPSSSASRNL